MRPRFGARDGVWATALGLLVLIPPAAGSSQSRAASLRERLSETATTARPESWQRGGTKASAPGSASDGSWAELVVNQRAQHTAIYDPIQDRMVVYGGLDSGPYGDLWVMSLAGTPAWTYLAASAPPPPRSGHSAIYDPVRNRMVVFGGNLDAGATNEVWALSLSDPPVWTQLVPTGTPPSARAFHSAIYDPIRDRMIVFGGYNSQSGDQSDVWALSLSNPPAWTQLAPAGTAPAARDGHSAMYDPVRDRMLVFGGICNCPLPWQDDVWALPLSGPLAWAQVSPAGSGGIASYGQCAIYDPVGDRIVVFGGDSTNPMNYVRALPLADPPVWTRLAPTGGPPSGRYYHTGIYDPVRGRMVTFGGWIDHQGHSINDSWALSLGDPTAWEELSPANTPPTPREGHTAIYDAARDRMVLSGGVNGFSGHTSFLSHDTWTLSLGNPTIWAYFVDQLSGWRATAIYDPVRDRVVVFGGQVNGFYSTTFSNDVWALSLADPPTWTKLSPSGALPAPRSDHSAIYDPVRDRMVIFGGQGDSGDFNDVWALSLADPPAWTQLTPYVFIPTARDGHSAIYDPVQERMVVFGGTPFDLNETWALSLAGAPVWSQLVTTGPLPDGREYHTAIYDPVRKRMIVYGGQSGSNYLSDVWALALDSPAWTQLSPAGAPPAGRRNHSAIYDQVGDQMVVFGGAGNGATSLINDVWALRFASGVDPVLLSLVSAAARNGRVELEWYAATGAGFRATVFRRTEDTDWQSLGDLSTDGTGHLRYEDPAASPGERYGYRLGFVDSGAEQFSAETWVDVPALELTLEGLRPNPASGELVASFTLPNGSPARLELLDVTGRVWLTRAVGDLGAGSHLLHLGSSMPVGMYWLRLTQSGRSVLARGVVVR
jgi:hypothetical protein